MPTICSTSHNEDRCNKLAESINESRNQSVLTEHTLLLLFEHGSKTKAGADYDYALAST